MSTYRTLKGYNIKSVTSDPSNTKEGQIWYNDISNKIRVNTIKPAVFASGGNLNETKQQLTGCGTQTANLAFGGENNQTVYVCSGFQSAIHTFINDFPGLNLPRN